jgi:hypothetical protein
MLVVRALPSSMGSAAPSNCPTPSRLLPALAFGEISVAGGGTVQPSCRPLGTRPFRRLPDANAAHNLRSVGSRTSAPDPLSGSGVSSSVPGSGFSSVAKI